LTALVMASDKGDKPPPPEWEFADTMHETLMRSLAATEKQYML
jgi:hypothetical protein